MPEVNILREDLALQHDGGTTETVSVETVRLKAGDREVVGNLYRPKGAGGEVPAAVVAGSLTSVKEMMGGIYARALAERGVAALAIDYSDYGESGGEPRLFDDPSKKLEDLKAAAGHLAGRDDVSGVGMLGVCTSGGNAMYVAADPGPVGAVATAAGWFSEPSITPDAYGGEDEVKKRREAGEAARRKYEETGEVETIPAYSDTDETASHMGPMEYYMDAARGGGVAAYDNRLAVMSWGPWMDFDPVARAAEAKVPVLIVHSDDSAFPDQAKKVHEALGAHGALHWTTGAHFDFYDHADKVAETADAVAAHFKAHLA
ncbi:alpha/beta hydrolase [Jannaschia sp. Os4]|uniref:alpha/beta hydrolase n=1 Tax=Jannaschia sp. Os4 TaxID=2807617 RepID=UPI00193ADF12|nr:alpha/beta hydrolase [Jannaschia sp. Os4]MBM2578129.1 alpha/beta hydrolase [Jannaschia sp. Os4]